MDLDGIKEEISFWDQWFKNNGGIYSDEYTRRCKEDLEFDTKLQKYIENFELDNIKILDAGSGPVSSLGKVFKGKKLNIKAVDPLAKEYSKLYEKYNFKPIVITEEGSFLTLSKELGEEKFDFVYSRNSLDHCENPLLGIVELIKVAKKGSYIFFENAEAEATSEKGEGLHQWDFLVENNDLVISHYKTNKKTYLKESVLDMVSEVAVSINNHWIEVEIKK